jgi:hypothetical protein
MDFLADLIRKEAMVYAGFLCPLCMFILGWSLFYCMSASNYRLGCSGVGWKCRPLQAIRIGSFGHVIGSAISRCRHLFDEFFLVRCLWFAILILIVVVLRYTLCEGRRWWRGGWYCIFLRCCHGFNRQGPWCTHQWVLSEYSLRISRGWLEGAIYVVDVVVSRFSIRWEIINF